MDPGSDAEPLSFLARPMPSWVRRRVVVIAPGFTRGYDPVEWAHALVVVERGAVELHLANGRRLALSCGDVVWLAGLAPTVLENAGTVAAVLVAVARAEL